MVGNGVRLALPGLAALLAACSGGESSSPAASNPVAAPSAAVTANTSVANSAPAYPPPAIDPPPAPPVAQIACAPCGKIVFTSSRDGNDELYSVNADGTGLTRLTSDAASDDHAAWSPDGARIAFTSNRVLVVMNADGAHVIRHSLPQHDAWHPSWSADGTRIVYTAVSDGSANLWQVDADGGYPALLFSAPGWDDHAAWSPDGKKLALVSDWFAYDLVSDIFLIAPDGSGFTPLIDGDIFDRVNYLWPSWAPDGAKLATTLQQEIARDQYSAYLGVVSRDGSGSKPLIAAAPWSRSSWSPDGTMIAFTSGSGAATDVSWIRADGSAQGTIVADGRNPAWQPIP